METSPDTKDIFAALVAARGELSAVPKSGENKYDRYTYSTLEDYVSCIDSVLVKHGLMVLTDVPECAAMEPRTTSKGGTEYVRQARMTCMVVHTSGQWIKAAFVGEGQDRADKGLYKAITGGRKYELASLLCLATTDDPERDETVGTAAAPRGAKQPPPPANPDDVGVRDSSNGDPFIRARDAIHAAKDPGRLATLVAAVDSRMREGKLDRSQCQQLLDLSLTKAAGMEARFSKQAPELQHDIKKHLERLSTEEQAEERF